MSIPRVSVCIPSYNYAHYLPRTVESILAQSYTDYEIIIVDDASPDDSLQVAEGYASRYPEKVFVYNHPGGVNKGVSATCNLAIEKSRGEYLAWLGSDDMWYPGKLALQVEILDRNPSIGLTYSCADIIDSTDNKTGETMGKDITSEVFPMLIAGNFIPHLTVLHRKVYLEQVGSYDESLLYSDWEMWLKLANVCQFHYTPQPLALYRVHGVNMYTGSTNAVQNGHNIAVMDKCIHTPLHGELSSPSIRALLHLRMAHLQFVAQQAEQAVNHLCEGFSLLNSSVFDAQKLIEWFTLFNNDPEFNLFTAQHCQTHKPQFDRRVIGGLYTQAAKWYQPNDLPRSRSLINQAIQMDRMQLIRTEALKIWLQSSIPPQIYSLLRAIKRFFQ